MTGAVDGPAVFASTAVSVAVPAGGAGPAAGSGSVGVRRPPPRPARRHRPAEG